MTEYEYEEWFNKWLGDIESLDKSIPNSPFANAPKPFNNRVWLSVNLASFIFALLLSLLFSYLDSVFKLWILSWLNNAFLSISFGLLVSSEIFVYTNLRETNVQYYNEIIPLLKKRYDNLHTAFFEHTFKLSIYYQGREYQKYYEAWSAHSNTCIVIVEFYKYLFSVFLFRPKCFTAELADLDAICTKILNANQKCQEEYFSQKTISEETYKACNEATQPPYALLMTIEALAQELQQNLYILKYSRKIIGHKANDMFGEK